MGTTLTAVYVGAEEVAIAHVGDSRAYCLRDGELLRLTDDHSLVDELIRQGKLTPEEAVEHPQRSVITRALGPEPEVEIDTRSYRARAGDVYLLCSDGLTTMVPEGALADDPARPRAAARRGRGADRGGERGGRTRQHHGRAVPPRGGRDRSCVARGRPRHVDGHPGLVRERLRRADRRRGDGQSGPAQAAAPPATLDPPLARVAERDRVSPRRPRQPAADRASTPASPAARARGPGSRSRCSP